MSRTNYAPTRELISIEKFAVECNVSEKTIRKWINEGRIPAYRVGDRLIKVDRRDVDLIVRRARPEEVSP